MIRVSAGIIRRADGRFLICRRGEGRNSAHLWEFPGGKQESGETAVDCLARELLEELNLPIRNAHTVKTQENGGIVFDFVSCETDAEPTLTEHEAYAWVTARDMLKFTFCPADTEIAAQLALNSPKLTAFFWDFDGTLMDTYPPLVRVMLQAVARVGGTAAPEHVLDLMKDNLRRAIRSVGEANGMTFEEFNAVFREEEKSITYDEMKPLPGIPETLRTLKERGGRRFLGGIGTYIGDAFAGKIIHHLAHQLRTCAYGRSVFVLVAQHQRLIPAGKLAHAGAHAHALRPGDEHAAQQIFHLAGGEGFKRKRTAHAAIILCAQLCVIEIADGVGLAAQFQGELVKHAAQRVAGALSFTDARFQCFNLALLPAAVRPANGAPDCRFIACMGLGCR